MISTLEQQARELDASEPNATRRHLFHIPAFAGPGGQVAYLAGNSLGLQPRAVADDLAAELRDWAVLGVEGHREAAHPWVDYHELLRAGSAQLLGAQEAETVAMNSLTVNLHLLMASFYRPTAQRFRIVIEDTAFPSDSYAVRSHAAFRGFDPDDAVLRLRPRKGESTLRTDDVVDLLASQGERIALVLLGGVNYLTGQLMDIASITAATHRVGAVAGWDLAHAVGNVELSLHEWDVDFAAWCTYKYLNAGPGAVAGAFVHRRHLGDPGLNRLAGWWSNDPANRFQMLPTLTPVASADAWQVSNPPILAMAPVLTSLRVFADVGMAALSERRRRLTGYLEGLLDDWVLPLGFACLTPRDPEARGAQLSVDVGERDATRLAARLRSQYGVIADVREPHVLRFAPVPLYSTFHDCWRTANALAEIGGADD